MDDSSSQVRLVEEQVNADETGAAFENDECSVEASLQGNSGEEGETDWSEGEEEEEENENEEDSEGEEEEGNQTSEEQAQAAEGDRVGVLRLGKEYDNWIEARRDIFRYSVNERKNVKFIKSEKVCVTAACVFDGCPWRVHTSIHSGSGKLRIKTLSEEHLCINTEKNKLYKIPRIVEAVLEIYRQWPKIKASEIRAHILSTDKVRVTLPQCREVRRKCRQILKKEHVEQFERLWDYIGESKQSNPGSNVVLETESNMFKRMYIMFGALKEGWKHCRNVIHLDGAFLKWELKGELLSAVGRDANDQLYPIAWAIVEVENKKNWDWFIEKLTEDLNLGIGDGLTVSSDQQKGIIFSVQNHLPVCEHRMCARHIWSNLRKKCNDDELKLLFYKAAKSYTETEFQECMEKLKMIQLDGCNELIKTDPMHWSRAFFSTICKCDCIDNNFSESFNSSIREARRKPVVEMLELIRQMVMKNNAKKLADINEYKGLITPKAQALVDAQKEVASSCTVFSNGQHKFEVIYKCDRYVINLQPAQGHICSCRYSEVTGIPCGHIIAAVWEDSRGSMQPEYMVADRWTTAVWKDCYSSILEPVNGMSMWSRTTKIKVLPPPNRVMPSRPRKNDRRKDPLEKEQRRVFHCKHCKQPGHNLRTCPKKGKPRVPSPVKQRRGRPRIRPVREPTVGTSKRARTKQPNNPVPQTQESCSVTQPRLGVLPNGFSVYTSPLTGLTYIHAGPRSLDTSTNTVFSTSLQRERDLQKIRQMKRASTSTTTEQNL